MSASMAGASDAKSRFHMPLIFHAVGYVRAQSAAGPHWEGKTNEIPAAERSIFLFLSIEALLSKILNRALPGTNCSPWEWHGLSALRYSLAVIGRVC